jgi:hypothetical protein
MNRQVQKQTLKEGDINGSYPSSGSTVTVHYTGKFQNGTVFFVPHLKAIRPSTSNFSKMMYTKKSAPKMDRRWF